MAKKWTGAVMVDMIMRGMDYLSDDDLRRLVLYMLMLMGNDAQEVTEERR